MRNAQSSYVMGPRIAVLLLAVVIAAWGVNWSVTKALLSYTSPLWASACRSIPACVAIWAWCAMRGRVQAPTRKDMPVVLSVGLLHMVVYSVLCSLAMQYLSAGRAVVLAYITPLWVIPGAWLVLGERMTVHKGIGLALGLAGVVLLLRPVAMDWSNGGIRVGYGLIILASLCWAACIVIVRGHRWPFTTMALLPWQILLATCAQVGLAWIVEGPPRIAWTPAFVGLVAYASMIGTVLGYWAMNTVNRELPASVTSMGLLGVPVFGVIFASLVGGETIDAYLVAATCCIAAGVAVAMRPLSRGRVARG